MSRAFIVIARGQDIGECLSQSPGVGIGECSWLRQARSFRGRPIVQQPKLARIGMEETWRGQRVPKDTPPSSRQVPPAHEVYALEFVHHRQGNPSRNTRENVVHD